MQLKKSEILILGAGGSIGAAMSEELKRKNFNPLLSDKKNMKKNNFYKAELKNTKSINNFYKRIFKNNSKIKILINCSGYIHSELSYNFIKNEFHNENNLFKIFNENLTIPYLATVLFAKNLFLKRSKGLIINFSSTNSNGQIGQAAYSASKKGIEILTKVWAKEFSSTGIRFACIAPGYISLKSTFKNTSGSQIKKVINENPSGRLGTIQELIKAIYFIIENDYFNGKTLYLDGGQ